MTRSRLPLLAGTPTKHIDTRTEEIAMPITTKYLFLVSMDVDPAKEALFNEVYDTEHVPLIVKVPGVRGATRIVGEPFAINLGGEKLEKAHDGPRYTAIYEIDNPGVLLSPEWAEAAEKGRWPGEVRPHTHNRRHWVCRVL
jgi:hypothetical protein